MPVSYTKGSKHGNQNLGARKPKGLNRIDKIKGPEQDSQHQLKVTYARGRSTLVLLLAKVTYARGRRTLVLLLAKVTYARGRRTLVLILITLFRNCYSIYW